MADDEYVFRGHIGTTSLAEMLATIHRHGVPGVLTASRQNETTRVFIDGGDIIFATSTECGESLIECLLSKGKITAAQQEVVRRELDRSPGVGVGEMVVQMGYVKADDLAALVREQVLQALWKLFGWEDGEIVFRVGGFPDSEIYRIRTSIPWTILAGCKQISEGRQVTERLGGRQTLFRRLEWPPHLEGFRLEAAEMQLLEMVDGKLTLYELCEKGPMSQGGNARVLYALWALGLIVRESESSGHIRIQLGNSSN